MNESSSDSNSSSNSNQLTNSVIQNMIAGGTARIVAASSLHPIDLAKTRMQFQRKHAVTGSGVYYKSGLHCIVHTARTEGPLALYRGLAVRLLYAVPSAAVNFTLYAETKKALVARDGTWYGPAVGVLVAVITRVLQTSVRTPFDVVKQQMQVQGMTGVGLIEVASGAAASGGAGGGASGAARTMRTIVQKESVLGFFSGFAATIARDVSFAAVYFGSYEALKYLEWLVFGEHERLKFMKFGLAGAGAGAIGTVITIPLDVVKTRLQTQAQLAANERMYSSSMDVVRSIRQHEGMRAFWRGCGPRILQTMPAAAITFATFEWMSAQLKDVRFL